MIGLPPEVLLRIAQYSLALESSLALPFLSQFGREFSNLTLSALLGNLALPDDDALLLAAEDSVSNSKLSAIYNSGHKANLVKSLQIQLPTLPYVPPLDDTSFLLLLAKLPALTNFTFSSNRLPPSSLCAALSRTAKSLTHLTINLCPRSSTSQPNFPTSLSTPNHHESTTAEPSAKLRWDAEGISALPGGLLELSISNLSLAGATNLANAFNASSFPELDRLTLQRTAFVDDTLLLALAEGSMKLTKLRIIDMSGTKLTGEGLRAVFENDEITELVLDNVQGPSISLRIALAHVLSVVKADFPSRAGSSCHLCRRRSLASRHRIRKKAHIIPGSPIISIRSAPSSPVLPSESSPSLGNKVRSEIRHQRREPWRYGRCRVESSKRWSQRERIGRSSS